MPAAINQLINQATNACTWPGHDPLLLQYHDEEWGVPLHDDQKHFEFMVLDAFQAGLSWRTVLYRREAFRKAFDGFDVKKVAKFSPQKMELLMQDAGIIRNRQKIMASVSNAQKFMEVQQEFGSFNAFIWRFVSGMPIVNSYPEGSAIPAVSAESDALSKALRGKGFKFVGSTICYAYMQAAGLINDHRNGCLRKKELLEMM